MAIIGAVLAFAGNSVATAADGDVDRVIEAAIVDADAGRCDEAYRRLAPYEALATRAHWLAGRCRLRARLYPDALADLDRIRDAEDLGVSQRADVELYRAVALYQLERFAEAEAALDAAEADTTEDAQYALYRGLIDLKNGRPERAAPMLESAARIAPETTEPVASYYAGMAWLEASERGKARLAFQRVVAMDEDGPWGKEAAKMLASTELFPSYLRVSAGLEYDTNVILQGGQTQFVTPGTGFQFDQEGKEDGRGVWRVETGVRLFSADDWSAGLTGRYYGNAHFDLTDFNTNYPRVGAYVARRIDRDTTAQARYEFGHAWLASDSFLQTNLAELGVAHTWRSAGRTIFVVDVLANDLRFTPDDILGETEGPGGTCPPSEATGCGPDGLREDEERNQDGVGYGGAIQHELPIPVPTVLDEIVEAMDAEGGYRFRYYDSEGDEWEHMAHLFHVGLGFELPFDMRFDTRVTYEYRDFANPSTFPDRAIAGQPYVPLSDADREEHEVGFEAGIEKALNEYLSVSARWSYRDTESNRRVYDYTRHIVGAYLNFRFD